MKFRRFLLALNLSVLLLTTAVLTHPAAAQGADDSRVAELLAQGHEYLAKDRPKRAIRAFTEAVELSDRSSLAALNALARTALQSGDRPLAIDTAERLLEVADAPGDRMIGFQILGTAHLESRKGGREAHLTAATDAFRQAMALAAAADDASGTAQYSLAMALEEGGATDEALELLRSFPYETASGLLARPAREQFCKLRGPSTPEHLEPGPFDSTAEGVTPPVWPGAKTNDPSEPPPEAEGHVESYEMLLLIDRDGCVAEIDAVEGSSVPEWLLDSNADSAYLPALKDGQPVAVHHVLSVKISTSVTFEPVR